MNRVYNFSAGPAALPEEVLTAARDEMLNYRNTGISVMEMSHRSADFKNIIEEAEADLRKLLSIPDNYQVFFIQGGASLQFSMIPLNLMKRRTADYIITGYWAQKAFREAQNYGTVRIVASSENSHFSCIPDCSDLPINPAADYVYICENNTIYGTKFKSIPDTKGQPLIADMSSCLLSEEININRYGLIFAGAQKNIGPAGTVIVIIRSDLISDDVMTTTPTLLKYVTYSQSQSLYNTPPTYGIYICGKVFKWLLKTGGLKERSEINKMKANILYDYLDDSRLFKGMVRRFDRSLMNATFTTGKKEWDDIFVAGAEKRGLVNLKGHRHVGGMRASIYNAMPPEGVRRLVDYMKRFECEHNV